ncbi:class I SAM-dependent methyltransferase [Mitsuaria sp. GD03876]|uniref:class I SAM-dependent methyltransferase n=1 Tax=Mitsuaria sp. GD03876 TaxID=2975399 RepID=UPI00244B378E|nr:class I SAM-dependent methyltransferase [Mitsuaria sp. GD03876]MDH0866846.1 class I SAM-dependent methyltransferase [Mitsuaria sp. GD03876]
MQVASPLVRIDYPHLARREMLAFLPRECPRLLDVGCNTGAFGEAVKAARPGTEVWGVEPDAGAAERAGHHLDHVMQGYFGAGLTLPEGHFDVIVFNDVLEHMPDPWAALNHAAPLLAPGGQVVVSLPNLLHLDTLWPLVRNRDFRYESSGVRDRTHLRFFTRTSALRMFDECGYEVLSVQGINEQWYSRSIPRRIVYRLFGRQLEETKYVQYAFVARPAGPPRLAS